MTIVFYVSGHGFGHASRDIELSTALTERCPDLRIRFRTAAPRWLFDVAASGHVDVDSFEADTGVVQVDSLRIDEEETVRRAAAFYARFEERAAIEATWLRASGAKLVAADIPPLAFAAAARAGLPAVAIGNFTWDWIYEGYERFRREARGVIDEIRRANASATVALRLPLHGGFQGMAVRDIPFIARRSKRDRHETRTTLGIPGDRPVVLASFGGYGATLPVEHVAAESRLTVIETRVEHVEASHHASANGRLIRFGEHELYDRGFRYEDLVAAADVVVTKPGYGIVSECIANDTALLYTSRGRFVEYDVFVREMPQLLRCRYLPQEELLAGRGNEAVTAGLASAAPAKPRVDGAAVAASEILQILNER